MPEQAQITPPVEPKVAAPNPNPTPAPVTTAPVTPVVIKTTTPSVAAAPKVNTPAVVTPPAFKFDEQKALAHLTDVVKYLEDFAGKDAHNPFLVIHEKINPLHAQLKAGIRTEELWNKIFDIKKEAPIIPSLVKAHEERKKQEADRKPTLNFPPAAK